MNAIKRSVDALGRFFVTVVRSCYDMEFYRAVRVRPWTRALSYLVLLQLAIGGLGAALVAPTVLRVKDEVAGAIDRRFPDGAELRVRSGKLIANFPTPLEVGTDDLPVVIDPSHVGMSPPERFEDKENGMLVGGDAVFAWQRGTQWRTYPLSEFPDGTLTKRQALDWIAAYATPILLAGIVLATGFYVIFVSIGGVLYVAIAALAAMLLGRLWKVRLPYGRWFAVGLHAVTLPILVNIASGAAGVDIPFAFTFITFMFFFAVVADERSNPVAPDAPPASAPKEPPAGPPAPKPKRGRRIASGKKKDRE
jgi:hypothetical protein